MTNRWHASYHLYIVGAKVTPRQRLRFAMSPFFGIATRSDSAQASARPAWPGLPAKRARKALKMTLSETSDRSPRSSAGIPSRPGCLPTLRLSRAQMNSV